MLAQYLQVIPILLVQLKNDSIILPYGISFWLFRLDR